MARSRQLRFLLMASAAVSLFPVTGFAADRMTVAADPPPALAHATRIAATAATRKITVDLILPLRDAAGAAEFAGRVSTPGDTLRGHYLTPAEFAERFGAPEENYAAVASWAQAQGLAVQELSSSRTVLAVTGTVAQIDKALGITINDFRAPDGHVFFAAATAPSLPRTVSGYVTGIVGLSNPVQYAPLAHKLSPGVHPIAQFGTGAGGAYSPADLRSAYQFPEPPTGEATEVAAVFEQGGFAMSDINEFYTANKLPAVPVRVRAVDGYGGGIDDPGVELEAVLDVDMLVGGNPGLRGVLVYEDGNQFGVALLNSLTAMAKDDVARTISISYGIEESDAGKTQIAAEGAVLTQMAAQGQTVLVSSGDAGAYGDTYGPKGVEYGVEDPGSQPFVTSVGGTTLFTGPKASYELENVWNDLANYAGATGGGSSRYWKLPAYQLATGSTTMATGSYNGVSNTMRNVPDVAAVGDPLTGVAVYSALYGGWVTIGGTSVAAPVYAGLLTFLDELYVTAGLPHLGFYNPSLYVLGNGYYGYGSVHDIRNGSNGNANEYGDLPGYSAGYNFDDASGWGSPVGGNLLTNLLFSEAIGTTGTPAAATDITGKVTSSTATITWRRAAGVNGYLLEVVDPEYYTITTFVSTKGGSATATGLLPNKLYVFEIESLTPSGATEAAPLYLSTTK